jgi:hypothetical protein
MTKEKRSTSGAFGRISLMRMIGLERRRNWP